MVLFICLKLIASHPSLTVAASLKTKPNKTPQKQTNKNTYKTKQKQSSAKPLCFMHDNSLALRIFPWPYWRWQRARTRFKLTCLDFCWILGTISFVFWFIQRTDFQEKNTLVDQAMLPRPSLKSHALFTFVNPL